MILDIITAALIVVPMGIGMARGAAYILVRALGWIGAMAASIAQGRYGVPEWMARETANRLPEHLRSVVDRFCTRFVNA